MKKINPNTAEQNPVFTSRFFVYLTLLMTVVIFAKPTSLLAQDWHQVLSNNKVVSVLFPNKAETFEVVTAKTPAGEVKTEVSRHQGEGFLFTISDSPIPGVALLFAGNDTILKGAATSVVNKAYGKMISTEKKTIDGAPGLVVRYKTVDFKKKDHPGYSGLAIIFISKKHLYTINSMLSKESAGTKAAQDKLLNSIKVKK